MGTLFEQKPRETYLSCEAIVAKGEMVKEIANKLHISFSEALELYLAVAKINDYDVKDEQLAGFGDILNELIRVIMDYNK